MDDIYHTTCFKKKLSGNMLDMENASGFFQPDTTRIKQDQMKIIILTSLKLDSLNSLLLVSIVI